MNWFIIIRRDTGAACSIGTVVADPLPDGLEAIALSGADGERLRDGTGRWDEATRSVVAVSPPVPQSVTARQIRLWLVSHGVSMSAVDAAIDAIPDATQREMVRVEWEYAPYVERSHPMLGPLAAALGLSEAQVDAAFREAATI